MDSIEFWRLIEVTRPVRGEVGKHVAALRAALAKRRLDDIVEFERHLNERIAALSSFDVLAANFIIQSYVSGERFTDFRAWIISQGRTRYAAVLENVESIAGWLQREDVKNIDGSGFVTVAAWAYEDAGGDQDDFHDRSDLPEEAEIEQDWPDDRHEFEARWPMLYKKFWNQAKVQKMHGGQGQPVG